jgi:thiosulfate/3-mercaptopyruvate sulfurtransferase
MLIKRFSPLWFLLLLTLVAHPALADRPDFLVDADWLEAHHDDPHLVLLEVRYYPHRYYTVGHIPGARQVQRFKDLHDHETPIGRFPSREAFEATLRSWGVNDDSLVVIYDDSRTALASRLYFLLDLFGFDMDRVKVMEGGTIEWEAFNPLSLEAPQVTPGTVRLSEPRVELLVEWTEVYDRVYSRRDPSVVLLDLRPVPQYTGEVINGAVRGGHIPGAVNVVSLDATDGMAQTWHGMDALARMYGEIPGDSTVYAYCHDGYRSTLAYMQLKALDYEDVRVMNGGWAQWGNELSLPVVEGPEPLDASHHP